MGYSADIGPESSLAEVWKAFVEALQSEAAGAELDGMVAAWIRVNPGVFEGQFQKELPALARLKGVRRDTALDEFVVRTPDQNEDVFPGRIGPSFSLVKQAINPVAGLGLFVEVQRDDYSEWAREASFPLAAYWTRQAGGAVLNELPIPPESRDTLLALAFDQSLPPILPSDVAPLGAAEISRRLGDYTGTTVALLNERLRDLSFLAATEDVGEVIERDAQTLRRINVSHQDLAERLELVLDFARYVDSLDFLEPRDTRMSESFRRDVEELMIKMRARADHLRHRLQTFLGRPPGRDGSFSHPWTVELDSCMGHHPDPFHAFDMYGVHGLGSTDFTISSEKYAPGVILRGGDLAPLLIRRACFLEGNVRYRIDPETASAVLALLD